jgi:hypothetical protein
MSGDRHSTPPPGAPGSSTDDDRDDHRSGAKKLVSALLKKGIESGIDAISKSEDVARGLVEGMKIPKEMASLALEQIDETKTGVYRAVAKEIRDFLNSTNFDKSMKKVLTGLAFEVKMEVRLKSAEDASGETHLKPEVSTEVSLKDPEKKRRGKSE